MTNTPSPDEDRELIEAWRDTARQLRAFWTHDSGTSIHILAADNLDKAADRIESLLSDREQGLGGISGSREPSPSCTGLGPSGFDPGRDGALVERVARALSAQHSKVTGRTTGPDFHWKLFEDQAIVAIDAVLNKSTDRG